MLRNLNAEQARADLSNQEVASILGMSRVTYEKKKNTGNFTRSEIAKLLNLFKCKFEYLFAMDGEEQQAS